MRVKRFAFLLGAVAVGLVGTGSAAHAGVEWQAEDQLYETPFETPVEFDLVGINDLPEWACGAETGIVTDPQHGTIEGDTYTPDAGFSGADEFTYFIGWYEGECEVPAGLQAAAVANPCNQQIYHFCDTGTIMINVGAPPATTTTTVAPTTTTTTTVAAAVVTTTTSTTVATQATLPVTGKTSGALAAGGFGALIVGLGALMIFRRHNRG